MRRHPHIVMMLATLATVGCASHAERKAAPAAMVRPAADTDAVSTWRLADMLVEHARNTGDGASWVAAIGLLGSVQDRVFDVWGQPAQAFPPALVAEARAAVAGDPHLTAVLDRTLVVYHRGGKDGPQARQLTAAPGQPLRVTVAFELDANARVYAAAPGAGDVVLTIRDDQNRLACGPRSETDRAFCAWTPKARESHVIEVAVERAARVEIVVN